MIEAIPYRVDINRILEVLASQIHQSPLALLREHAQNAYDAILQRQALGQPFDPRIDVDITKTQIRVKDNGIGMTKDDLKTHFWQAGSSGKNTPEARAAGVVGTFGIGAMANFGVATELTVITESALVVERTRSNVARASLSATDDCISLTSEQPTGYPGTEIIVDLSADKSVDAAEASTYLSDVVRYLPIPVFANGVLVSQQDFGTSVQRPRGGIEFPTEQIQFVGNLRADASLVLGVNAEPWVELSNFHDGSESVSARIILVQEAHQIRTSHSAFVLATTAVKSTYGLGGVADMLMLEPTAGREALTTGSIQFLQSIVTELERHISERIGGHPSSDANTHFMEWTQQNGRYDLCSHLRIHIEPDNRTVPLGEIRQDSNARPYNLLREPEQTIIEAYATDESPLLVLATRQPRKKCEDQYLRQYCKVNEVQNVPTVLSIKEDRGWSLAEAAMAFRLVAILETDYFVGANVQFGKISHNLPMLVNPDAEPITITLDDASSTVAPILQLYKTDFVAFTGLMKDFIRTSIFPKIASRVPSSTRDGAEAFLRSIRRPRDVFEYEKSDQGSLGEIWLEYLEGKVDLTEAARRSTSIVRATVQILDTSSASSISDVLPDVVENEQILEQASEEEQFQAFPPITRLERESDAKLLTLEGNEPPLNGYNCFIAITDRVRRSYGEFFLQPHRTEIVWGGQKALYIFQHHSGEFALYYELQGNEIFADAPSGQAFLTSTIVLKNQVYIPVPDQIKPRFIPGVGDRKRFEVRCDLLYPEARAGESVEEDSVV